MDGELLAKGKFDHHLLRAASTECASTAKQ
jgi:hypothetical protein